MTIIVQLLLMAILPPVKLTKPVATVAVAVPPQVLLSALGVATNKLAGKLSVNATLLSAEVVLKLVMVSLSAVVPPLAIKAGVNVLLMVGLGSTTKVALAVLPVPTKGVVLETAPEVLL